MNQIDLKFCDINISVEYDDQGDGCLEINKITSEDDLSGFIHDVRDIKECPTDAIVSLIMEKRNEWERNRIIGNLHKRLWG